MPSSQLRLRSYETASPDRTYVISFGKRFFTRSTEYQPTSQVGPLALAHLVLDHLPAEAIPEVLECMANAWTFYMRAGEVQQPTVVPLKRLKGRVTRASERPSYALPEE